MLPLNAFLHFGHVRFRRCFDLLCHAVARSSPVALRASTLAHRHGCCAAQQNLHPNVRIGSFASFPKYGEHVRFTPECRHRAFMSTRPSLFVPALMPS